MFPKNLEKIKVPENQEKIALIETLKTGAEQKANLILVLLGEKPGLALTLFADTPEEISADEEKIKNLGLKYQKVSQEKKGKRYSSKFLISKNQETLDALTEVDPAKNHEKYGALMGYPDSAIKAFLTGDSLSSEEERKMLSQYPEIVFRNFRLSKDSAAEEIELLKHQNNLIKNTAPNIYNELKG
ncbi:MAG: hypothetical protein WC545_01550 [Patescibacteria group bacterium]